MGFTLLGTVASSAALSAPPTRVVYTVTVADIPNKTYRVTVKAEGVTDPNVSFALPAWSPGWYVLTNAYKNVSKVVAAGEDGKPLPVTQSDKHTWQVETKGAKAVTLSYNLLAKDQDPEAVGAGVLSDKSYGFFEPYLDRTNGFVPGPASLMYVVEGKTVPCSVTYKVPAGWKIASANEPTKDPATFTAPDYDTLADQPADLGKFVRYNKVIEGAPVSVVVVGVDRMNHAKLTRAAWKISEAGIRLFGNGKTPSSPKAPFPRYVYHFRFPERSDASMGLEHLNSTVISMPRETLEDLSPEAISLIAHEYIHTWNVKRIRPEVLGPFDYTKPVRNKDLWWLEGVTDYFAPRLMVEAGLTGADFWRGYMAEQISTLQNNPARKRVTLEQASLGAWEGRSEGFGGLSYYNKGLLVGMLLDIEMRRRTANRVGLEDLVRELLRQTTETGKGYSENEIEKLATKLTGEDLTPFFDRALRSTEELPYKETLQAAGLTLDEGSLNVPDIGAEIDELGSSSRGVKLGAVTPGGEAEKAGIQAGDVIVGADGKTGLEAYTYLLESRRAGDRVKLTVLRDGARKEMTVTLAMAPVYLHRVVPLPAPTPLQSAILASITGTAPRRETPAGIAK